MPTTAPRGASPDLAAERGSSRTRLKAFVVLMVAAAVASAAILPYARELAGSPPLDASNWWILLVAAVQNLIVLAPLTALGLWLGPKIGLGTPLVTAWLAGDPEAARRARRVLPVAAGIGAATGVLLMVGALAFVPWLPDELAQAPTPTWWQGLLAALSAGVTEELMLRLGVMTVLAWVGTKLARQDRASPAIVWTANGLAAVAFGALHLPLAASLAPLTPLLVVRTVLLNTFAGMVFGWTFWRRGLVAAMVAHTSADIVLHVLSPLILGAF